MRIESVTSAQNPKIKTLVALQEKARLRNRTGLFVVEGLRELVHCVRAGFETDTVFVCPELLDASLSGKDAETNDVQEILEGARQVVEVPAELYSKIAYRGTTEGIIAEVKAKERRLEGLHLQKNPLVVVLEGVEKPGNLGAVLRSADAAGVDAVLLCDPLTDLYNPNLIRASIGAVFTVPVVCCSSEEAINWLKNNNIHIFTGQLQDSELYYDTDMRGATAIIIGTEATGLTELWRQAADAHIRIPMLGRLDSLNASVSAAVLMFEAVRQRNG